VTISHRTVALVVKVIHVVVEIPGVYEAQVADCPACRLGQIERTSGRVGACRGEPGEEWM